MDIDPEALDDDLSLLDVIDATGDIGEDGQSDKPIWHLRSMGWRRDDILKWHRLPGERIIYCDSPSINAFMLEQAWFLVVAIAASFVALIFAAAMKQLFAFGVTLIVTGFYVLFLLIKRRFERYTMYVLTSARVMRLSGAVRLKAAWIPWGKVTDVRLERSFKARVFGYATVYIDSANERSGLGAMANLSNPYAFYSKLTAMVQLKQGNDEASEVVEWDHAGQRRTRKIRHQQLSD